MYRYLLKELKVKISIGINHELFNLMSQRIIDLKKNKVKRD